MKVPLAKPEVSEEDIAAVVNVLRSSHLSQGATMLAFEKALADYLDVSLAVVVNSGTSALQLALRALEIKDGDEVILPSFSFMAVTNAVLSEGAVPVFVDIDPKTLNMDPASLDAVISRKTKAIILVHSFGFPVQVKRILEFARHHSLAIIEDACEALGSECHGHKAGTLGDIGIFAFYPNKVITTGEGGAAVTGSGVLADRLKSLRNQGRRTGADWLQHYEPGFSYRLSDINCALGLQQLSRIEHILSRREELAESYRRRLRRNTNFSCFDVENGNSRVSWFTYPVLLNDTFSRQDRDAIRAELSRRGIECARYFAPSHLQPALFGMQARCGDLAQTISVADRLLCLPVFNSLTEMQIELVCASLDEVVADRRAYVATVPGRGQSLKKQPHSPAL
jgi:dTDP-4-amino-4,6-dideoxygalactose transaminase